MAKDWIENAIKKPGALKRAAMRAKEGTQQYAEKNKDASGVTGKRSRLALTLARMHKG